MKRLCSLWAAALLLFTSSCKPNAKTVQSPEHPTFSKDIAPILFENCASCHREKGMGPFNLLTYSEIRKHARQIAEVTQSRFMPPWPPQRGGPSFVGERILSDIQIETISRWVRDGAPEGNPADCPKTPVFESDWQLGKPDLVLTMPEAFLVPPEGRDIYQNFVLPVPNGPNRFVKAVEILPDNPKLVHHAFINTDRSGEARRLDEREPGPGFSGMSAGPNSTAPAGFFAAWHPGSSPRVASQGIAWTLEPNTDIVLQMHLRPSGKQEKLRASVGFYFTDIPPSKFPFCLLLRCTTIDIPADATDTAVESSYKLPVDVSVIGTLPHTHYLAQDVRGWAELPNGKSVEILHIPHWDFNWQNDYEFREPLFLPKGSTLRMRYTFDNSSANPRNPNTPPKRVQYGLQSSDEMAELWFQILPTQSEGLSILQRHYFSTYALHDILTLRRILVEREPHNVTYLVKLASALVGAGAVEEALSHLQHALEIAPENPLAHRLRGQIFSRQEKVDIAISAFNEAIRLDPLDSVAHSDLGWIYIYLGRNYEGIRHLEESLRINPNDEKTQQNLQKARSLQIQRAH